MTSMKNNLRRRSGNILLLSVAVVACLVSFKAGAQVSNGGKSEILSARVSPTNTQTAAPILKYSSDSFLLDAGATESLAVSLNGQVYDPKLLNFFAGR